MLDDTLAVWSKGDQWRKKKGERLCQFGMNRGNYKFMQADRGSSSGSVTMNSMHEVIPNSGKGEVETSTEGVKSNGQCKRVMFESTAPDKSRRSMLRHAAARYGPLHCEL